MANRMLDAARMVAEVGSRDPAGITNETTLAEIAGWDSLKMVRLVVTLEQSIGRELEENELETLMTVGDVADVLSKS